MYVPNRLAIKEIAYKIVRGSFIMFLLKHNKKAWPSFPIKLGHFYLINFPWAMKEFKYLKELVLLIGVFRRHDLKGVMRNHCRTVKVFATYNH
jgi:hypothetical protein